MNSYIRNFIVIALSYFIIGKLSLLLAVPPGYVTPVFPSAGIALASLLLLGLSYAPAVWVGSIFINLSQFHTNSFLNFDALLSMFMMAAGSTLLPIIGYILIKKFIGFPSLLNKTRDVIKFILLAGPVSCIVSATIGSYALLMGSQVTAEAFMINWWSWWIGDSLGVIIFCPLVLTWFAKPREQWAPRRFAITVPLVTAFAIMTTFYIFISRTEEQSILLEFRRTTFKFTSRIQNSFDDYTNLLFPLSAIFQSFSRTDKNQFQEYTKDLISNNAGIKSIAWVEWVPSKNRAPFENTGRNYFFPGFEVTELNSDKQLVSAKKRPYYAPIRLLAPLESNESLLGFDLLSIDSYKKSLEQSRETTSRGTLQGISPFEEFSSEEIVTIFKPVYYGNHIFSALENRRKNIRGFFTISLKVNDVVNSAIKNLGEEDVHLTILPENASQPEGLNKIFSFSNINILGKKISLLYLPSDHYLKKRKPWLAWGLLAAGLLFNGLLGAFMLIITGNKLSIEQRVEEQTKKLRENNLSLKELLEELKRNEEKFRLLVSAIKDYSIIMLDKNGNIISWNEGAEKIMGYKADEILGKHFSKFYAQDAIKLNKPSLDLEIVRNFETFQTDQWRIRKGGVKFLSNTTLSAVKNSEGELLGFVQVIRDLTEYKNKEATLKKSEELYRNLFNSAQDIVGIAKFNGTLLTLNPAFEALTGWQVKDWIGKSYRKLIVPEDLPNLESILEKVSKGLTPPAFECRIYTKNNEIKTFESTIRPILEDRKPATKSLIISRDVSYRKYSEELVKSVQENLERQVKERTAELTTTNENLQKLNLELEKFTSIASHDLKEPLRTVSNYMSLLLMEFSSGLSEKAKQYILFSVDATKRMQRLVNDLLNYSIVGTSKETFKKIDYQTIVEKVLNDLKVRIEENNAQIKILSPLPTIYSGESQIAQLFQNLIGNAIKYRGEAPPRIEIDCKKKQNEWCFSVKDNGIGFDMRFADKIFQAFHRLHESSQYPGTGIGLAICKKIIDRHKGKIWVESRLNHGSIFYFSIPIHSTNVNNTKRILYADDSIEMRELIKKLMEQREIIVDTVKNGEECLKMALQKQYDLILMDIQMPLMDGIEATVELRRKKFNKPIIAFTGHYIIQQDNKSYYQKDGFTDYFSKNDDISTLPHFIEKYVTTA